MAPRYFIETYGCQMNVHDSERMAGLLEQAGYEPAATDADADLIVVNTCSVREHAEDKLYTRLGEINVLARDTGRRPTVAVAGCVAQQEGDRLLGRTNGHLIDVVIGTQRQKLLPMLVQQAERDPFAVVDIDPMNDVSFPLGVAKRQDPVKAFVTIIEGCNDHCSFCVVPGTRGPERMRRASEIVAEATEAVASGHREIHLLGQIVNHYQDPDDPEIDFAALLERVDAIPEIQRIRFASPHPRHTGERLIAAVRDLPHVCRHLHLPVQSGSTTVLAAMRRRHTRDDYLRLVERVRHNIPDVQLSTDVIVGFPGETAQDFDDTLSLAREVRFSNVFSFKYSTRPGTLAARRLQDSVPEAEKTLRIVTLQEQQREIQQRLHAALLGTRVEVLVDSLSRRRDHEVSGRTSGNIMVHCPGDAGSIGRLVPLTIERAGPHSLWGTLTG
ncbi:MAG: tRNA (N6-isopentenyl adenosine(37)-C2)-methylthiotransferase MiaB [Vicinamibacterales bacterium]|nr:tRNA (N6-isopentenyl adenosine(37)-C2)-methylthiotransferase MiaB [Vicinamibacterales bacterium]